MDPSGIIKPIQILLSCDQMLWFTIEFCPILSDYIHNILFIMYITYLTYDV